MIYPNIIIIIHDNGYTIQVADELHGLYNYYKLFVGIKDVRI